MSDNEVKMPQTSYIKGEDSASENGTPAPVSSNSTTPAPQKIKTPKSSSKKRKVEDSSDGEKENTPVTPTPKKSKARAIKAEGGVSAKRERAKGVTVNSSADFTETHHILIALHGEGKTWKQIDDAIEAATGTRPGDSTMRKLLPRLTAILDHERMEAGFTKEDKKLLFEAYDEIDKKRQKEIMRLENKLWEDIKDEMVSKGGNEYDAGALKKKYTELTS